MVAAHMDEVGLMIVDADSSGGLKFGPVGGLDARQLAGKPVWIGSERKPGIIGAKPMHLTSASERKRKLDFDDLTIDIGVSSKEAAKKAVQPGTHAAFATPFTRLGPTIRAKALDDRLGVASLIELVLDPPPGIELLAAFTVQEEVGLRGARVAAHALDPDAAVALDCTPARDLPPWGEEESRAYNTRLGAGPALYIADGRTIAHPGLVRAFLDSAERHAIGYQIRQPGGGATDAGAIHLSREGIPSLSLSVPGRYLHGPAAIVSLADWRASLRWLYAALAELRPAALRR
jgi:endoglucanase